MAEKFEPKPGKRVIHAINLDKILPSERKHAEEFIGNRSGLSWFEKEVRHGYSLDAVKNAEVCPKCGARTEQRLAKFGYATSGGPRIMLAPAGWFCSDCPTVVIDETIIRQGIQGDFNFVGIFSVCGHDESACSIFQTWNGNWAVNAFNHQKQPVGLILFPPADASGASAKRPGQPRLSISCKEGGFFRLRSGPYSGKPFAYRFDVCPNPQCPCSGLDVRCIPMVDDLSAPVWSEHPAFFQVDCGVHQVDDIKSLRNSNLQMAELAETFVNALSGDDWTELRKFIILEKRKIIRQIDPETCEIQFPAEYRFGLDHLIPYIELFPFAENFTFNFEGKSWSVVDSHCLNPACTCLEVDLQFFRKQSGENNDQQMEASCTISYNLSDHGIAREFPRVPRGRPTISVPLMEALHAAFPEADSSFAERRRIIRRLFERWLAKPGGSARRKRSPRGGEWPRQESSARKGGQTWQGEFGKPKSLSKPILAPATGPGRNDLCPCGSGKKFKKCCLGK